MIYAFKFVLIYLTRIFGLCKHILNKYKLLIIVPLNSTNTSFILMKPIFLLLVNPYPT